LISQVLFPRDLSVTGSPGRQTSSDGQCLVVIPNTISLTVALQTSLLFQ
jgi:hypothetical protein